MTDRKPEQLTHHQYFSYREAQSLGGQLEAGKRYEHYFSKNQSSHSRDESAKHQHQHLSNTSEDKDKIETNKGKGPFCSKHGNITSEQFLFSVMERKKIDKFRSPSNLELDPRDEKIKIRFKSEFYPTMVQNKFKISMQPFLDELRDWLVDLIEITTSIGYNHLKKETLSQKQTKSFVAKNILEHVKQIFQYYKQIPLQHKFDIMKFINNQSYQIFDHIARKYPQTRSKGVSKRIKSKVPVIDNRDSNDFDFLLRNNIQIQYREDGDYSEDIMKIINKLITFSNEVYDKEMELEDTNYEVFSDIMEYIFSQSIYQPAESITNQIARILNKKKNKVDQKLQNFNENIVSDNESQKQSQGKHFSRVKDFHKQVLIGHKIPIGVPLFSDQDIKASKFKVVDSSILRLLTKWAQQLRNKIINAQETIYHRRFKFKNNKGKRINLQPQMKSQLYDAGIKQIQIIKKQLQYLKEQNNYLQTVFAGEQNYGKYAKHDTKVGVFAAKLNQIASQYIFKYLNRLIHSLLTIPRNAAKNATSDRQKTVISSVNLVSFKIGDMMRCKCSCSEHQFIKILKAIQSIHHIQPDILKISRIKNRLETENNDIMINFFFGNKAECQLQLSVFTSEKKEDTNSSKFSHLIYEIIRAELGPISQMASIIVQYDPLAYQYSKKDTFGPQLIRSRDKQCLEQKIKAIKAERKQFRIKMNLAKHIQLPFVCCNCQNLSIVHNPQFYYRDFSIMRRACNNCLTNSFSDINTSYQKVKEHILLHNFDEAQNRKQFFRNHAVLWNSEIFINKLKKQSDQDTILFPAQGFLIRCNQKKPKLQLFTCIFQPSLSSFIFVNQNDKGQRNVIFTVKIHKERQKKINNILKELKKFTIFELSQTVRLEENGERYYSCDKIGCCGLKINPGPILNRNQVQDHVNDKSIKKLIDNQNKLVYLNYIPNSFQKLEKHLNQITQKNKTWKIRNTVRAIEAFQCDVDNIKVVGLFAKISDLNIGDNPRIRSLEGIQNCLYLNYLNCSNCDLTNIDPLKKLKQLQTVLLMNNKKLESINGLEDNQELLDLSLRNTAVSSLNPLSRSLKLQSLDLEGCQNITSIREVKSTQLSYISIINCLGMTQFDLPSRTLKSLKTVELTNEIAEDALMKFMSQHPKKHDKRLTRYNSEIPMDNDAIKKINSVLKTRKASFSYDI